MSLGVCRACACGLPHEHVEGGYKLIEPRSVKQILTEHRGAKWPIKGEALACMPDQVPEVMAYERKRGVAIEYARNGQPIYHNQAEQNAHAKLHRLRNYSRYT